MIFRKLMCRLVVAALCVFLVSCDQVQFGDRYGLSKDEKGRVLRIDKRTGEIAIVSDGVVTPLKDAKDAERKERDAIEKISQFKNWPSVDLKNFNATANLATVWRDGRMLYSVTLSPEKINVKSGEGGEANNDVSQESNDALKSKVLNPKVVIDNLRLNNFSLIVEDVPFEIAKDVLSFTQVVDDAEKPIRLQSKGEIVMSSDSYQKIDGWSLSWRRDPHRR